MPSQQRQLQECFKWNTVWTGKQPADEFHVECPSRGKWRRDSLGQGRARAKDLGATLGVVERLRQHQAGQGREHATEVVAAVLAVDASPGTGNARTHDRDQCRRFLKGTDQTNHFAGGCGHVSVGEPHLSSPLGERLDHPQSNRLGLPAIRRQRQHPDFGGRARLDPSEQSQRPIG